MGKLTISMAMFNSYVTNSHGLYCFIMVKKPPMVYGFSIQDPSRFQAAQCWGNRLETIWATPLMPAKQESWVFSSVKTLKQGLEKMPQLCGNTKRTLSDFGVENEFSQSPTWHPMSSSNMFKVSRIPGFCLFQKLENGGKKWEKKEKKETFWFPRSSQPPKKSDHKRIPGIQEDRTMRRQFRAQGVYQSGRLHVIFA